MLSFSSPTSEDLRSIVPFIRSSHIGSVIRTRFASPRSHARMRSDSGRAALVGGGALFEAIDEHLSVAFDFQQRLLILEAGADRLEFRFGLGGGDVARVEVARDEVDAGADAGHGDEAEEGQRPEDPPDPALDGHRSFLSPCSPRP